MTAERVTWRPSARELSVYVGRYGSPELETFYTLMAAALHLGRDAYGPSIIE